MWREHIVTATLNSQAVPVWLFLCTPSYRQYAGLYNFLKIILFIINYSLSMSLQIYKTNSHSVSDNSRPMPVSLLLGLLVRAIDCCDPFNFCDPFDL